MLTTEKNLFLLSASLVQFSVSHDHCYILFWGSSNISYYYQFWNI